MEAGWTGRSPALGAPPGQAAPGADSQQSSLTRCVCKRVFLGDPRGQQCQDQNRSEYSVVVSVHLRPLPSRSRFGTPYFVCVCACTL